MKINPKLYCVANEVTPIEIQELGDRKVELFLMGDFNGIVEEFVIGKQQFAVWSSEDGKNYRLFLEDGYYNEVKSLYSSHVNGIWLDFWDEAEKLSTNHSKKLLYPMMGGALVVGIGALLLRGVLGDLVNVIAIICFVTMLVVMFVAQSSVKKKITKANSNSRQRIVEHLGAKKFDELLDKQSAYMDEYYDKYYAQNNDELEHENEDIEATPSNEQLTNEATVAEETAPSSENLADEPEAFEEIKEENN